MPDPTQMTGAQWIVTVLVGLVLVGLQAYVVMKAKNVATQQDVDELTRVVEGIKADHARDLERLKSVLLKDVEAHRIRYETELRSYKEIWAAAYDVYTTANGLRRVHSQSTPEELQFANDAQVAYLRAAMAYEKALWRERPFFPDDLYRELQQFRSLLEAEYHQSYQTPITTQIVNETYERRLKILASIESTCEAIRTRLHSASQGEGLTKIEGPGTP